MFDKLYKEANDEIPVNMLLMESLKKEAAGGKKKKSFGFMYRYGFAAAAVVIMVVSLNVLPDVEKTQEMPGKYPGTKPEIVTYNAEFKKVTSESSTNDESETNISQDNISQMTILPNGENNNDISQNNMPDYNAEVKVASVKESRKKSETKTENVQAESLDVDNASSPVAETEMTAPQPDDTISEDVSVAAEFESEYEDNRVSAGGGGGSARMAVTAGQNVAVDLNEYCATFGFKPELWNIPEGMSMIQGSEVHLNRNDADGRLEEISHTVIYSGNGRTIYVTMFPDSGDVTPFIKNGNGEMYNGNLILENSELSYAAYIVKNGNGYIVETNNLEKESVYSLIDSIR